MNERKKERKKEEEEEEEEEDCSLQREPTWDPKTDSILCARCNQFSQKVLKTRARASANDWLAQLLNPERSDIAFDRRAARLVSLKESWSMAHRQL